MSRLRILPWTCVPCLLFAQHSHAGASAGGALRVSSDDDKFLPCIRRGGAQRLLASMLQNQCDCFTKIREALFTRFALAVGSGHLRAIRDVHGPSCSTSAVNSLCMSLFYRRQLCVRTRWPSTRLCRAQTVCSACCSSRLLGTMPFVSPS